jgi:hypothetical protein
MIEAYVWEHVKALLADPVRPLTLQEVRQKDESGLIGAQNFTINTSRSKDTAG